MEGHQCQVITTRTVEALESLSILRYAYFELN